MAKLTLNESFSSLQQAVSKYGHIVYDRDTNSFQRAGVRHAIASYFSKASAVEKNKETLNAVKSLLESQMLGRSNGVEKGSPHFDVTAEQLEDSFRGIDGDKRIESSTVRGILAKFRNDPETGSSRDKEKPVKSVADAHAKSFADDPRVYDAVNPVVFNIAGSLLETSDVGTAVLQEATGFWGASLNVKDIPESVGTALRFLISGFIEGLDEKSSRSGEALSANKVLETVSKFHREIHTSGKIDEYRSLFAKIFGLDSPDQIKSVAVKLYEISKSFTVKGVDVTAPEAYPSHALTLLGNSLPNRNVQPTPAIATGNLHVEGELILHRMSQAEQAAVKNAFNLLYERSCNSTFLMVLLSAKKDALVELNDKGLLTAKSALRTIAEGVVSLPQEIKECSFTKLIEDKALPPISDFPERDIPAGHFRDGCDPGTRFKISTVLNWMLMYYDISLEEAVARLLPGKHGKNPSEPLEPVRYRNPCQMAYIPSRNADGKVSLDNLEIAVKQMRADFLRVNEEAKVYIPNADGQPGKTVFVQNKSLPLGVTITDDVKNAIARLCGNENTAQQAAAIYCLTQSSHADMMPFALRSGLVSPVNIPFNYIFNMTQSGDLDLLIVNTDDRDVCMQWDITIHRDGTTTNEPVREITRQARDELLRGA